ncbi:MAG: PCMD domain-containing protein [Alistipes sp.]|nr:PCMD domain-containing protein [Alistipes sp.]MDE7130163.1 PCMD domain-containing protein [Alistipes sp.]
MKKIFSILCMALLAASCNRECGDEPILPADQGALKMEVVMSGTPAADQSIAVKIYRVADTGRQLIRRYTSLADIPDYLALLADNYCVTVDVGDKLPASMTEKSYYGEKEFRIEPGAVAAVAVDCRLLSTIAAVEYDSTVKEQFASGYTTTVAVGDSIDGTATQEVKPQLIFSRSGEGYFILPEEESSLAWRFEGTHPTEGRIEKSGIIAGVKPAARYTLRFAYSKDANGMIEIIATVDESLEEFDDNISFSPDPTILGDGFDLTQEQRFTGGEHSYLVSALAAISELTLTVDSETYDLLAQSHAGIGVTLTDEKNIVVTLSRELFDKLCGGSHTMVFNVKDADGGKLEQNVAYLTQGINPLLATDYDLWDCTATFSATVFDADGAACAIEYRQEDGQWQSIEALPSAGNTRTATGGDFFAGKRYEYRLLIDNTPVGASLLTTTPDGVQLPNAGMESWSKPGKAYLPYADGEAPFWQTGNPGSTSIGEKFNLTTPSDDIHAGSEGSTSAYLKSQYPSVAGIGKFAAGNLFIGEFSLNGMNGIVDFGRPFTYTAKPKALSFWLKNNPGQINYNSGKPISGTDINQAVIILAKWNSPRRVDTSNIDNTFLDVENLDKEPGVVAYGLFRTQQAAEQWYERTIELTYISDERPDYIMVSFAASAYGDYFCGSTDSYMYVDDIKLIY